jgi:hypothetical protein
VWFLGGKSKTERTDEDQTPAATMIELENLRTASLYINNQLLSRGLLRDGNSIDFARPGDSDDEIAETMSRIMGVVNDLILRRDVRARPILSSCKLVTDLSSVMLSIASRFPQLSGLSVPSPSGRPTISSAYKKDTPRHNARSV